jgi:hypothetical protein
MEIPDIIVRKTLSVLARNLGDTRLCPVCLDAYIPKDKTAQETLSVYVELRDAVSKLFPAAENDGNSATKSDK